MNKAISLLLLFDWVSQCAFPSFGLSGDLKILAHWAMQAKPFDHFEKQGRRGWRALKRSSASAGAWNCVSLQVSKSQRNPRKSVTNLK